MKSGDYTYVFTVQGGAAFFSLILSSGAPSLFDLCTIMIFAAVFKSGPHLQPTACLRCASGTGPLWHMSAGTPDQDLSLFEEILVECTAFQLAGALTPESIEEAIDAVTQSLLTDGSSSSGASTPHAAGSTARTPATTAAIEAVMAEQQQHAQQGAPPGSSQPAQPEAPPEPQAHARPAADDNLANASAGQLIAEGALCQHC